MTGFRKEWDLARPGSSRVFLKVLAAKLPSLKAHLIFWPLVVFGITLDLWSKRAVFDWLESRPEGSFSVIDGFLQLVTAVNEGAAFGIAAGQRNLLIAVSVIALTIALAVFFFSGAGQKLLCFALGLFTAGICGNLYDRIFNDGLVRDFIDVVYWPGRHWPAFNVADSMLCIAVGLLIVSNFTGRSCQRHAQQRK